VAGEGGLVGAEHAAASIMRVGNDVKIRLEAHKLCLLVLVGARGWPQGTDRLGPQPEPA
jgi:hypothetical protein